MAKARHKSFTSRVCLICCRAHTDSQISRISMRQFLQLFQRYLISVNCDGETTDDTFPLAFMGDENGGLLQGLEPCQDCYYLVEDFCKVYDQMKCAEMKLNWRVKNFRDILTCANKVPSRIKGLWNLISNENKHEASDRKTNYQTFNEIASFRKKLIAKCSSKVGSSYPKVRLKRCDTTEASRKRIKIEVVESHLHNQAPSQLSENDVISMDDTMLQDDADMNVTNISCVKEAPVEEDEYDDNSDELMVHDKAEEDKEGSISINSENSTDQVESMTVQVNSTEVEGKKDEVSGSLETNSKRPRRTLSVTKDKQDKVPITKNRITKQSKRKRITTRESSRQSPQHCNKSDDISSNRDQTKLEGIFLKQLAFEKVVQMRNDNLCSTLPCISKSFLTKADLINHSKHHGEFRCNFCDEIKSYSSELVAHEIKHHSKKHSGDKIETCPRCQLQRHRAGLEKHYMKSHLNLIPNRDTCPICRTGIHTDFVFHYEGYHNLTKTIDLNKVHLCQETGCRAYFQTFAQLNKHKENIHQLDLQIVKYSCQDCNKTYTEPRYLRKHRRKEHFTVERFNIKCTFDGCDNLFESQQDMELHRRNHEIKKTRCQKCGKDVTNAFFGRHLASHKSPKIFPKDISLSGCVEASCNYSECFKVFYNEKDLEIHSQLHGNFKCQYCGVVVTYALELATHEIDNHTESDNSNLRECSRCQLSTTKDKLVAHFVEEHLQLKMDRHTCPICRFEFKPGRNVIYSLRGHFKGFHDLKYVDSSGKPYECKEAGCSAYFLSNQQLIKHKNLHSISGKYKIKVAHKSRSIECLDCGKIYQSLIQLRRHQNQHIDMRLFPLPCITDGCPLRFKTQDELDEHIAETEMVKCPDCNKTFHGIHGLKIHQRFHRNGKKTWVCETCGLKLRTQDNFKTHSLTHGGPDSWDFMCSVCSKKCPTQQNLDRHMRIHTNEKPFVCEVCGVKHAHLFNLRRHVKAKHKDFVMPAPRKKGKVSKRS